ncbi:hypothetical protein OPV22_013903 [Ensete ventricosum]|uniref:Uncharacterized protein n=1 Tax=Ensete ventricosum TaxID=4639 RepID=A0AAV8R6K5_ENSVE|nr:hypothetical protein OPV22_013903 [Ensete ventricosum]
MSMATYTAPNPVQEFVFPGTHAWHTCTHEPYIFPAHMCGGSQKKHRQYPNCSLHFFHRGMSVNLDLPNE